MNSPDWDRYAELGGLRAVIDPYDTSGFKNILIDQIQWSLLKEKLTASKRVLDFGCGTGRFASRIQHLVGAQYAGVDTSELMVRVAKDNHQSESFVFSHFNGLNVPYRDNSFDACVSCGVLQYVIKGETSRQVLAEVHRILVPGGRLIMIEQASESNQTSGLGMRVLTESDYREELSKWFNVQSSSRVRSCEFSRLSRFALRIANRFPLMFESIKKGLAKLEIGKIQHASKNYISSIAYYDILIDAIARVNKEP